MYKILIPLLIVASLSACNKGKKQQLENEPLQAHLTSSPMNGTIDTTTTHVPQEDTTICKNPVTTAMLEDQLDYFRTNNRFKKWDKKDKKVVCVRAIIEKDGSPRQVLVIKSSGNEELDREAIRLIENATITPAKTELQQPLRSLWMIPVYFPPN